MHVSTGDALSSDQTEIIGDIEQGMVLDVSLTANGTEIHSFNGKVTVSVPFTWTQQGVLQAWYLADDGKKEPVEVAYRDGNAVLTLKHFSIYAIVVKANDPDSGIVSIGENEVTVSKSRRTRFTTLRRSTPRTADSWPMPRAKLRRMKKP